jgi:hypothetical protein
MVGLQEPTEQAPKFSQCAARPGFFVQFGKANPESLMVTAMLACQFVYTPLDGFTKSEIIVTDCQEFV